MSGRKKYKPSWTIAQGADLIGNKQAVVTDRTDRWKIDNFELCLFWSIETARNSFTKKASQIRKELDIGILDPDNDIPKRRDGSKGSIFAPKRLFTGINSQYLRKYAKTQEKLTEAIYSRILIPLDWSFNFYSFVEYYVLYDSMHQEYIEPNQFQLELMLEHQYELFRNRYTKSDIAFLKQRARSYDNRRGELNVLSIILVGITVFKNKQRPSERQIDKLRSFIVFEKTKDEVSNKNYLSECTYSVADMIHEEEYVMISKKEHRELYYRVRKYYLDYKKAVRRYEKIFDN